VPELARQHVLLIAQARVLDVQAVADRVHPAVRAVPGLAPAAAPAVPAVRAAPAATPVVLPPASAPARQTAAAVAPVNATGHVRELLPHRKGEYMDKLIMTVDIAQGLCDTIDALLWEIKSNETILVTCMREGIYNDAVTAYRKDHIEAIGKLELLNRNITKDIVTPAMSSKEVLWHWNADTANGRIMVWGSANEAD
jgi:hypothetical protein